MTPLVLAACFAAQFPSPQAPTQGAPLAQTYAVTVPTYAAPQVVVLGAGQVAPAGPFGQFLGHVGMKLVKHSWPRVQPVTAAAPVAAAQVVYVQVQQPAIQQALYVVQQPPVAGIPPYGSKQAPQYATPQQQPVTPTPSVPKPSESVPPVPNR